MSHKLLVVVSILATLGGLCGGGAIAADRPSFCGTARWASCRSCLRPGERTGLDFDWERIHTLHTTTSWPVRPTCLICTAASDPADFSPPTRRVPSDTRSFLTMGDLFLGRPSTTSLEYIGQSSESIRDRSCRNPPIPLLRARSSSRLLLLNRPRIDGRLIGSIHVCSFSSRMLGSRRNCRRRDRRPVHSDEVAGHDDPRGNRKREAEDWEAR